MKKYRIDYYTGWSVYDPLVQRLYKEFSSEEDASTWAKENKPAEQSGWSVNAVS